jgi:hypothetical protein
MYLRNNINIFGNKFNDLQLLTIYGQQNIYFSANPQYSLFYKYTNFPNVRQNNESHYRHTHFVTSNYILESMSNEFNLYTIGQSIELIYDIILETNCIPERLYLCCNNTDYIINININNIFQINNKYFIKIPLKKYNIDYINLGYDLLSVTDKYDFKQSKLQLIYDNNKINNNEINNKKIYIYGIIIDNEERRYLYQYTPYYNFLIKENYIDINNESINESIKKSIKKSILSSDGNFIIKNTMIQNISFETFIMPNYIKIKHGTILETLYIDDLLFYNKIYEDTIIQTKKKIIIKIPILFNQPILAFNDLDIKIIIDYPIKNIVTTLYYDSLIMNREDIDNFNVKINEKIYENYRIIRYFKHKKKYINKTDKKYIYLDDFHFPLKELFFSGNFNDKIRLQLHNCNIEYKSTNTKIINHISAFNKIIDGYNLISFCIDNYKDYTGEFILDKNDNFFIDLENIDSKEEYIDIYGIGYKIIKYDFNDGKLNCRYLFE